MQQIDIIYRTMIAELGQRLLDASFMADFPAEGRFVKVTVKDRKFWYFDLPDGQGGQKRSYVGRFEDDAITKRVQEFKAIKDDAKARRKIVSTLTRDVGLIAPDTFTGNIIEAFANAGLFRLRGLLVGTAAFQTYSALLGVRLPIGAILTGDADIAQDYAISAEVKDTLPPIEEILHGIDETFSPVPHISGSPATTGYRNATGYKVEFLTTNRGSDDYTGNPSKMPALGGASAEPLRFLDFLIYEPVRSVLLHKSGVSVIVPDPARYAVHKIIVAAKRSQTSEFALKRDKDLAQAAILFEALPDTGRGSDLDACFDEALGRGDGWRSAIIAGARHMTSEQWKRVQSTFEKHGVRTE